MTEPTAAHRFTFYCKGNPVIKKDAFLHLCTDSQTFIPPVFECMGHEKQHKNYISNYILRVLGRFWAFAGAPDHSAHDTDDVCHC